MEKKKKKQKFASSTNQETEIKDLLSLGKQNTPNVAFDAKDATTATPSDENANLNNQQYPTVLQWPYTPQLVEQSSMNSRPYVSTQSPSPVAVNQCQQSSHLQPNSASNHVPQGQPPLHLSQSTAPFWLPPRPGYQFSGVNMPPTFQTFTPIGAINGSWQGPAVIGVTSSSNQPQVPNAFYPVAYPYPGFPGPNWDPSSWRVQGQQSQLPSMSTSPGGYGHFSSMPPTVPGCSASVGQSFQRGIIRRTAKLSQKHQQLWEAQSAENVQLWTVIGQLQSELADYKNRLIKLEAEVSSLKPASEEPTAQVTGTAKSGQPSKRARPRKSAISVDVLPTADESYPRARARKPAAACKFQTSEARTHIFEKVGLQKVEDKEKARHSPATTEKQNCANISNIITNNCGNMEVNGNNIIRPAFNNQVHQENPRNQICDKANDSKTAFLIVSEEAKASPATHIGNTADESSVWRSNITPDSCGRTVFNMISQGFYDNGSIIGQGEKHIPGWSFVNEENASEQLEDSVAKDDNEEEMGDDDSSGGKEEFAPTKDESSYPWIVI